MHSINPETISRIYLTDQRILRSDTYQYRLKIGMTNLSISRRNWPDYAIDALYNFDGVIVCSQGDRLWPTPCIATKFGDPRWLSYFLKHPGMKIRNLTRLEILDAVFQIKLPNIHQHFIR